MIKEKSIVLNTGNGQTSFKTEKIMGDLCAVLIDSPNKISILIESELGYLIFKKAEIQGSHYLSVRNRTIAPEESMMDVTQFAKFSLNEPIIITVIGQSNQEVAVTLRLE